MMLKLEFDRQSIDEGGNVYLSFRADGESKQAARQLAVDMRKWKDKGKQFIHAEIKPYSKKRSLDANAYAWVLIGKIAEATRQGKEDIYFEMLKQYGQGAIVKLKEHQVSAFIRSQDYFEECTENQYRLDKYKFYRFWVGSSRYNTQEMAIFIDGLVNEAKDLGIQTMTPAELAGLKDKWGRT